MINPTGRQKVLVKIVKIITSQGDKVVITTAPKNRMTPASIAELISQTKKLWNPTIMSHRTEKQLQGRSFSSVHFASPRSTRRAIRARTPNHQRQDIGQLRPEPRTIKGKMLGMALLSRYPRSHSLFTVQSAYMPDVYFQKVARLVTFKMLS